jgi:hypothetical protein
LEYAGRAWKRLPEQSGRLTALSMAVRLAKAKRRRAVLRYPEMSPDLDEYPAVPFYTQDGRNFYYDSTSLAHQLDQLPDRHTLPLIPEDPLLAFLCQFIDESFDEFGLYMVHHMRWAVSARTTPMGEITARELRPLLPPGFAPIIARGLYRRRMRF